MILNIDKPFGEIQPDPSAFQSQLQELSKLTKRSKDYHAWAKNLRFITHPPEFWNARAEQRPEKLFQPRNEIIVASKAGGPHHIKEIEAKLCGCNPWSSQAIDVNARKLWLTDSKTAENCSHFVAVSYCWPSPTDQPNGSTPLYSLASEAGQRNNAAPNEVIRRAIKFTHSRGLSAFWIDQECIDQNDRSDKEAGIQSMDLVYKNAEISVGLLSLVIEEQVFLNFLNVHQFFKYDFEREGQLSDLARFVQWLDGERWFTRAWCMQEAWSSGFNMVVMMQHAPSLDKPSSLGSIDGEVVIELPVLFTLLDRVVSILLNHKSKSGNEFVDPARLVRFQRKTTKPISYPSLAQSMKGATRMRCSAAEGLYFLAVRENSRILDRLAILGNLCDFDTRLDTSTLDNLSYDFSTCAFALAALNGDMSLMGCLPLSLDSSLQPKISDRPRLGYSWGPPLDGTLTNLEWVPEGTNPRRFSESRFTAEGMSTLGWIWLCDLIIDVSPVKEAYQAEWETKKAQSDDMDKERKRLELRITWGLIKWLVHMRYYHLAQMVWNHENDIMLVGPPETAFVTKNTAESELVPESSEVPRDLRELIDFTSLQFIFRREPNIMSEQDFVKSFFRPRSFGNTAQTNRNWLVDTVMGTGRVTCGRQLNVGFKMPTVTTFSPHEGKLKFTQGVNPTVQPKEVEQIRPEDRVPGTGRPKAEYSSIFESETVFNRAVFTPSFQIRQDPHTDFHTWRPIHWITKRLFKSQESDTWKIEGGDTIRGYAVPTGMFSKCILV